LEVNFCSIYKDDSSKFKHEGTWNQTGSFFGFFSHFKRKFAGPELIMSPVAINEQYGLT
jgi:hypothetical protein